MIANKEQFKSALLELRDKEKLRNTKFLDMLQAQYAADGHTITATRLAQAV
jgi:hypothetical protein